MSSPSPTSKTKGASGSGALGKRDTADFSPDLARQAMGQPCVYTLPNGQQRPGLIVRAKDATKADIVVFLVRSDDAKYFHGGIADIENALYAPATSADPESPAVLPVNRWSWAPDSPMAKLWPATE